jgi:N-acetylmuramoyl-L-alanine amidase
LAKVFIGVGHGGTDSGAVGKGGLLEKALNLSIAKACGATLERHGVKVKLSRTQDENDPVNEEVAECNSFAPDLAVDIHNNAGGGTGAETFYTIGGGTGKKLAENIQAQIAAIGQKNRGAKTRTNASGADYYAFIRNTNAPAVIVECAFVDSDNIALIDTEAERTQMGEAIARGILKTLGIAYKAEKSPGEQSKLYRVQVGAYSSKANATQQVERLARAGFEAFIVTT